MEVVLRREERVTEGQSEIIEALGAAKARWVDRERAEALKRWLERTLDRDGMPRQLAVPDWPGALALLDEARRAHPETWPEALDARIEGFYRQILRFTRPDGSPVFGATGVEPGRQALLRRWADLLPEPGLNTVLNWWFSPRARAEGPPPLPAATAPDRPLAMLRANWAKAGDLVGIDHRAGGLSGGFELAARGKVWLGPTWTSVLGGEGPVTAARPTLSLSNASVDLLEWSFRAGGARVVRTALLFRGRHLALLGEQVEGPSPFAAFRIGLGAGVTARPLAEARGFALTHARGRSSTRVLALGLPRRPYETERGALEVVAGDLSLRQRVEGRRRWLPLLVSWDPARDRKAVHWRPLTVTERMKVCTPEQAVAYRVSWGRDESLLIYRSLGRPGPRAVLGHPTSARLLVGLFNRDGKVEPIVSVAE